MADDLVIRQAGEHDIATIGRLAAVIWPVTYKDILSVAPISYMMNLFYSLASLDAQFKKHVFLLAELNKEAVGFASFSKSDGPDVYKLHKLYVNTTLQGKGLGKALIKHIVRELSGAKATALDLNVNRSNRARFFYEKLGFSIIREEDISIGNNFWMNDYVMRLEI